MKANQVRQAIQLIDEGNTIPFIARYRKEMTGGLDDEQLRLLLDRLESLRALEQRRDEVLRLIEEQGVLTDELRQQIESAEHRQRLEDLYRPFRPKRTTRASQARSRGLEPLAQWLRSRQAEDPMQVAAAYVNEEHGITDAAEALQGAMDILAEDLSDTPDIRGWVRQVTWDEGVIESRATGKAEGRTAFEQYYEYAEPVAKLPPHRILALDRGEREEILRVAVKAPVERLVAYLEAALKGRGAAAAPSPADPYLQRVAADAYSRLLAPAVEREIRHELTARAEEQAIKVFASNLKALLLQPPLRGRVVMGLDPGYRTGCKVAIVDPTGRLLEVAVVYPAPPQSRVEEAKAVWRRLIQRYGVTVIALGNGTASRETEQVVADLLREGDLDVAYTIVNEAGASVYSASPIGRQEFPDLDVSERSAISLARRLQDPLAELVKIEPKSMGVGEYQHDVNQKRLAEALQGVVEDAVNAVGVDLNAASAALLTYIAGIGPTLAQNIVAHRNEHGPFPNREALLSVKRLGPKAFQQAAGFLRIPGAENPLDQTPIHPESYGPAEQLIRSLGHSLHDVTAERSVNGAALRAKLDTLDATTLKQMAERLGVGVPTLQDIVAALKRPGRDPREDLPPPMLRHDVLTLDDLKPGMVLTGTVRNVVDFGAFVDIGVTQDGLVHVSELANRFVRHPLQVVAVGDVVKVQVLAVDKELGRISLSMKRVSS